MKNDAMQERRLHREAMLRRLKQVMKNDANKVCSECSEPKPTWAVLLEPPIEGEMKLAVLCCFKCYSYHYKLGKEICTVKSAKMASEWTSEELEVVEKSGNAFTNAIYETFLEDADHHERCDAKTFVENKYKLRKYFSEQIYQEQATLRHVNRRAREQLQRTTSGRNVAEQSSDGTREKRPSLNRKRPSLHRSHSRRDSRLLMKDLPALEGTKSDDVRCGQRKSYSNDMLPSMSSHVRRAQRSHNHKFNKHELTGSSDHQVRRPSARSHSRNRLLAMTDHARLSSGTLSREESPTEGQRHLPSREASNQRDLQAMSSHLQRSRSQSQERHQAMSDDLKNASKILDRNDAPSVPLRRPSSRSQSRERQKAVSYGLKNIADKGLDRFDAQGIHSEKRPSSSHPALPLKASNHDKRQSASRHLRHDSDFIPRLPRRSYGEQDQDEDEETRERGVSRQPSLRRIPRLDRIETPIAVDDLDASDQDKLLVYNLRVCLLERSSSNVSDLSIDDDDDDDDDDDEEIEEKVEGDDPDDLGLDDVDDGLGSSLAAYVKRYQHSVSSEHLGSGLGPLLECTALASHETSIECEERRAFWQTKLAPLAEESVKLSESSRVSLLDSSLPKRLSASGRAA